MAHLLKDHLKPKHVIIVENLINFLTLPQLANSVGIWGSDFGVHILREIDWLSQCQIIYWVDIDAHGFQILSDLGGIFPHTQSVMMNQETYGKYKQFIVEGKQTPDENTSAQQVYEDNIRLEQEHIAQEFAVMRLTRILRQV